MTELWTEVRLLLYPVLLVLGLAWAVLFWVQYQRAKMRTTLWAAWLGLAVSTLGASGFVALLMARRFGSFSSVTSGVLTVGLAIIATVLVAGVAASGLMMWRSAKVEQG